MVKYIANTIDIMILTYFAHCRWHAAKLKLCGIMLSSKILFILQIKFASIVLKKF
jgi:hypothetical protein